MPKTRQQRMAEERAGQAPSPPQILADKPRVPTRTRGKAPGANNTVAAGPVLPVAQSAAPSPKAPQALVHVWADQDRYVYDPTHELTIPSALVPELAIFIKKLRDHGSQNSTTNSSSSATQVTPSLGSRQFAPIPQTSRTKPQVSGPSAPMAPQPASTGVISPFQEISTMANRASLAGIEQPFQQVFGLTPPLDTRANVGSHPQELHRSLTPNDPLPAHIEAPFQKTSHPAQLTGIDQPVQKISQSVTPTLVVEQALKTSSKSDIVEKQALADQKIREVAQFNQTKPMPKKVSSSKSQTGASGAARRKRRARSGKPSAPTPIKQKLAPVPSDPETIHGLGLPSIFRKHRKLPAYTANGHVFYGKVAPSDDYLKFQDETPTSTDSSMANASKNQALQASESSVPGRLIRPIRSVKRRFGFSPLTTISESSETTPPTQPANDRPVIRFPSRWLDRMNATKRKRWTSPTPSESIPNPKGKSYGNAEEDENEDKIAGQQPGKVRRTSRLQNFSSQEAANSGTSRPLTGQHSIIPKTPIPVTNAAGSFKVPSPGDSDWSDSESEHEAFSQAAAVPPSTTNSANPGSTSRPQFRPNGYENWLKTATPAVAAAVELMKVNHTAAGQTFEAVAYSNLPPSSRPQFNALGDWLQTVSPSVAAAIELMDVDPDMAGAAFQRGLDNYTSS